MLLIQILSLSIDIINNKMVPIYPKKHIYLSWYPERVIIKDLKKKGTTFQEMFMNLQTP
jgi:hypothetical protein